MRAGWGANRVAWVGHLACDRGPTGIDQPSHRAGLWGGHFNSIVEQVADLGVTE